jgi:hypothetical protein
MNSVLRQNLNETLLKMETLEIHKNQQAIQIVKLESEIEDV